MTAAVEVEGLTVRYPNGNQVLSGLDLKVGAGELVSLVGANGAGKSTLLRTLIRLQEPAEGTIRIGGEDVTTMRTRALRRVRTRVGFVFQKFNLATRMSVLSNVTMGACGTVGARAVVARTAPGEIKERAVAALERVGLADQAQRRVSSLSGGQQQRVAIARMLVQQPEVILADEPVASLDPVSGNAVMELLRSIAVDDGLTVIAALHQIDFALSFTDRVVGLQDGIIQLDQRAQQLAPTDLTGVYGGLSRTEAGGAA
ncbi:phosphonate ABC transporter ATP-binding protein [Enemella sp. A6]|uniref:phosphonate ABC transporter ATP-binding protein n=1 Tax=Enemella sp. A6 TaxID=3440152 RepID=UPI003EBEDB1A